MWIVEVEVGVGGRLYMRLLYHSLLFLAYWLEAMVRCAEIMITGVRGLFIDSDIGWFVRWMYGWHGMAWQCVRVRI